MRLSAARGIYTDRKVDKAVGALIGSRSDIEDQIIGLGIIRTGLGKRRGGRH
jgi:hypothetical protein